MTQSNIKLIARNFWKNRLFTSINVFGLAIGLATAMVIFLFVEYELSFDKQQQDHDQIYRVVKDIYSAHATKYEGSVTYMLSGAMNLEFPDYTFSGVFNSSAQDVVVNDIVYSEPNILYVDSLYFKIFEYEWLLGSPEIILSSKYNIALTESIAKKYFKDENPIGKKIMFSSRDKLQVVGLLKDPPLNTSQPFTMIGSIEYFGGEYMGIDIKNWGTDLSGFETYVKIPGNVNPKIVSDNMTDRIWEKYMKSEDRVKDFYYKLQPLREIHLQPDYENVNGTYSTSKQSLWIYSSIALLIIIIAAINFINLSTAHALKRSKEVGVKKVLGASNAMVSKQFLFETFIITFVAIVFGVIIVEIFLPYINTFFGNNYDLGIYNSKFFFVFLFFTYLFVGFLTGLYPAFILSRFKPINALKNIFNAPKKRSLYFRNALVVLQFAISIILLICMIVINKQMNYVDKFDLGFTSENIALFNLPENDEQNIKKVSNYLNNDPGIISYTFTSGPPCSNRNLNTTFVPLGASSDQRYNLNVKLVDTAYITTYDLELLGGRWIHKGHPGDSLMEIVVNETFIKEYGFNSIEEALNKKVQLSFIRGYIRGVVKDFNLSSLRSDIDAAAFIEMSQFYFELDVEIHPQRMSETLDRIQTEMSQIFPTSFITYDMLTKELDEMYVTERKTSTTITVFSALAILISSLGLFGLVSFMIVQRLKEVSIRKVLGSTMLQNMSLLFKDYLKLVLLACLLAIPSAWYIMEQWLNEFQYRTTMSWWIFVVATLITMMLAMITILYHVVKSSNTNPVESLNVE